jgi:hypothetical protein
MITMISATTMPYGPRRPLAVLDHLIAQVAAGEARWLANAAEAADGARRFAALARVSDERLTRLRASRQELLAGVGAARESAAYRRLSASSSRTSSGLRASASSPASRSRSARASASDAFAASRSARSPAASTRASSAAPRHRSACSALLDLDQESGRQLALVQLVASRRLATDQDVDLPVVAPPSQHLLPADALADGVHRRA